MSVKHPEQDNHNADHNTQEVPENAFTNQYIKDLFSAQERLFKTIVSNPVIPENEEEYLEIQEKIERKQASMLDYCRDFVEKNLDASEGEYHWITKLIYTGLEYELMHHIEGHQQEQQDVLSGVQDLVDLAEANGAEPEVSIKETKDSKEL